jgi:hypothetical protein
MDKKVRINKLEQFSKFLRNNQSKVSLKEKIIHNNDVNVSHLKKPYSKFFPIASASSTAVGSNPTPGNNYLDFKNIELKSIKSPFQNKNKKVNESKKNFSVHSPVMRDIKIDTFITKQLEIEKKEKYFFVI